MNLRTRSNTYFSHAQNLEIFCAILSFLILLTSAYPSFNILHSVENLIDSLIESSPICISPAGLFKEQLVVYLVVKFLCLNVNDIFKTYYCSISIEYISALTLATKSTPLTPCLYCMSGQASKEVTSKPLPSGPGFYTKTELVALVIWVGLTIFLGIASYGASRNL